MKWLVAMTVPCAFLALLCACGQERDAGTDEAGASDARAGGSAPDMLPPADEPGAREQEPWLDWRAEGGDGEAGDGEAGRSDPAPPWPQDDDDPSFDHPPGSGAWCGTGMMHPPSFQRDPVIVTFELRKGRIHRVAHTWSTPDTEGIERRFRVARLTLEQRAAMEARRVEIEVALHELADPMKSADGDAAALREELARIQRALRERSVAFVQYGRTLDGVRYESEHGESVDDFLARSTKEHAERDGQSDDPAPKHDGPRLPDPMADEAAGRAWSGPHADGFWRRLITDKRKRPEDESRFGPEFPSVVQWGLERDGVFYTSRLGESAEAFVRRVAKEAAAAKKDRASQPKAPDKREPAEGK